MPQRNRSLSRRSRRLPAVLIDTLEPRLVLTGYFAVGVEYNGAVDVFNEFGDYDSGTGAVNFGTREDSNGSFTGTPFAGFTFGNAGNHYQGGLQFSGTDLFSSGRVTVGFGGDIAMGFSVGYSGLGYQTPIQVNYLMNQATGLGTGSGGRDGEYFFNGVVRDVGTGSWSFNHALRTISGLDVNVTQTDESNDETFVIRLDPNAVFGDGYTLSSNTTRVAFYSDDLEAVQETDLDGSDGKLSYSLGMRIDPGTTFTSSDFEGDMYGLAITGAPGLADFFGQTAGGGDGFTYTGALELADNNTFRIYGLEDFYSSGRDGADTLLKGTFAVNGDEVRLTTFDTSRTLDLKFNASLRMTLPIKYNQGDGDHLVYGAGARIHDGMTGDFPAAEPGGDGPPPPQRYTFTGVTTLIGNSGDNFVIGKTDANEEVRFNITQISGLDLGDMAYAAWLEDGNQAFEVFGTTPAGVHYVRRLADGTWNTGSITGDSSNIPVTMVDFDMLPGGGMTLGGFNASGELLRFDCINGAWSVDQVTGIPAPDGAPGTPTGQVDLLVTPWSGWHLLYLDSAMSLRAAWTTPSLSTYYDNNLSLRAGLSAVDGNTVHGSYTAAGQISIGFINSGNLHNLWWRPGFVGNWNNTNFADIVGSDASGLSPDFVGTYADRFTGELLNFGVKADESDAVVIRFGASAGWEGFTIKADLGLTSYEIPEVSTLRVAGLVSDDGFDLQGKLPGLGDIPIVSRLFTNRGAGERDQTLLIYLTPSLVEPTDGE